MFEILMLMGFLYAGFCYLPPKQPRQSGSGRAKPTAQRGDADPHVRKRSDGPHKQLSNYRRAEARLRHCRMG